MSGTKASAMQVEVVGVPSDVAASLQSIVNRKGDLDAASVLAEAQKKTSPLHGYFEWDDTKAAAAHRKAQAEGLIRRVHVQVIEAPESKPIRVRAYIAKRDLPAATTEDVESGGYVPIQSVVDKGTTFQDSVKDSIRRDLLRLQAKYASTEVFFAVLAELARSEASDE